MTSDKTTIVLIPVTLEVVSGDVANGAAGEPATNFRYRARGLDGKVLAEDAAPRWRRIPVRHEPAKIGTGFHDSNGTFVLWTCDEMPGVMDDDDK